MIGDPQLDTDQYIGDDEDLLRRPRIGRPNPSGLPAVTLRGISPTPAPSDPALAQRRTNDEAEAARLTSTGSGISQIQHGSPSGGIGIAKPHPILGGILRGLDVAGSVIAPGVMANIPGTSLHHASLENLSRKQLGKDIEEQGQEAQAAEAQANAQAKLNPPPQIKEEQLLYDKNGTPIGYRDESGIYHGADDPNLPQGVKDVLANAEAKREKTPPAVGDASAQQFNASILRELNVNPKTAQKEVPPEYKVLPTDNDAQAKEKLQRAKDLVSGATGQQHISIDTNKPAGAESAQVERESRAAIRKAAEQYRNTQKSVGQLTASIEQAKDGNGLLTSFVPTMEVLGINAANGVHRISPAEAAAANLPGGWAEQFNSWYDKAISGKTTPQLVAEGKQLAHILVSTAYQQYKSTYEDESGIVGGYGVKDFGKRVPMIQAEQEAAAGAGPPAGATMKVPGSDGRLHWSDGKRDLGVVQP